MKNQGVLILSGFNIRAVVAFCRWAEKKDITYHIIARNKSDPIFLTDFCSSVFFTRENDTIKLEEFCGWIKSIKKNYSYDNILILPSTEFLNRFIINNRKEIEIFGGVIPLVDKKLYENISDKYSFGEICLNFGLSVPKEYRKIPEYFPFVAKPISYYSISQRQLKPYLIYNVKDMENFTKNELENEYYFQQYIEGNSLYLLANIPKNGDPVIFSQENLLQQKNGGSILLARVDEFHKTKEAKKYIDLLLKIEFYGLIMIEVRFKKDVGEYFMIEANPRLWGPAQLIVDNDVDIFGSLLRDYGFKIEDSKNNKNYNKYYFWPGGLINSNGFVYHNYSSDIFYDDFSSIENGNIFRRNDTINLFNQENA